MRNEQIIYDLELVIDHFKQENDGCFPLCLEEAQIALSNSGYSRYILVYSQNDDEWILLNRIYWDKPYDLLCFWNFLNSRYKLDSKSIWFVLNAIFGSGIYLDVDNGLKYEVSWNNEPLR